LRPDEDVVWIKMFSAMIDPTNPGSDARERQERYFKALRTLQKVRLILGVFQDREVQCKAECRQKYLVPEEKKTDVNLAVEVLSDAISGNCDSMSVVSGDSDIQPAIEWVAKNRSHTKITVYVPSLPSEQGFRRTDYYRTRGMAVDCRFLPLANIKDHQLPNMVKLPDAKFAVRPHVWAGISDRKPAL
jgi:hypothetical protein